METMLPTGVGPSEDQGSGALGLGCEGMALHQAHLRHSPHTLHQHLCSTWREGSQQWSQLLQVMATKTKRSSWQTAGVSQEFRHLAPLHNLILLPSQICTCGILGQACTLHLGQSHTPLQWTQGVATFNRMHSVCTLYKRKSVFRGLESESPGLLTAKHRPHHLLTAFFLGSNMPGSL